MMSRAFVSMERREAGAAYREPYGGEQAGAERGAAVLSHPGGPRVQHAHHAAAAAAEAERRRRRGAPGVGGRVVEELVRVTVRVRVRVRVSGEGEGEGEG
jgi:hypothetical protein